MTIAEKVKQLQCLRVQEVGQDPAIIGQEGIGYLAFPRVRMNLSIAEEVEMVNEVQRYCVQQTRLGVPSIVHAEALHGIVLKGCTCFPQQ